MRPTIWLLLVLLASTLPVQAATSPAAPTGPRWVEGSLDLAAPDLRTTAVKAELRIHKDTFEGETLTAADMARLWRDDREGFESRIEREVRATFDARLSELFPGADRAIHVVALDRASVEAPRADPYDPPLVVRVAATAVRSGADLGLGDLTDDQVAAAFAAGVVVTSQVTLRAEPGVSLAFTLHAPQSPRRLVFADGATTTVTLDNARGIDDLVRVATLRVKDATASPPTQEDASVSIVIDLEDVDVTAGQAASGDFGTLRAHVTVDSRMRALAVPPQALARLGDRAELPFVSAEGIRIALDAGFLSRGDLTSLDQALLDALSAGLTQALGAPVKAEGGIDVDDLVFHAEANASIRLSQAPQTDAAVALYSIPQSFTFPKLRGFDTTYTVILPPGLAVTGLEADGGEVETRDAGGGRQQFTVTPTEGHATATMSIAVTPSFVLAKFWPFVLLGVVLLVLVVGSPVAVVVLRRRRKAKTE